MSASEPSPAPGPGASASPRSLFGLASLPAPPQWLKRSPWVALGCAVLLAMGVLAFELGNLKTEREFTAQVTLEKGGSLINALEGALQTASGFHWTDEELQALLQRVGSGADIRALWLTDGTGRVLLGKGRAGASGGEVLLSFREALPPEALHMQTLSAGQGQRVRITRRIQVDSGETRVDHRHGGAASVLGRAVAENTPLWAVVEYDMNAIDAAQRADRTHRLIMGLVLVFLTFLAGMTWYLLRGYVRSRQMAQEAAAFAGHIVRTLPVGVIATDVQGRITAINPEALRITGVSRQEAEGHALPGLWPALWHPLAAEWPSGSSLLDRELRCTFDGRGSIPLSVSASPLHTESGEALGHVFIVRDLGDIRHLQGELRRRDRLAALGTLAARVAHEVRNPLSAIRAIARYFEECRPADSEDAELARTLGQEVLRLDRVVGELLDLARPDIMARTPVALDALVERARRMAEPALREHGVDFVPQWPQPPPLLMLDADRMGQVLINLFLNAVDAMRDSACKRLVVRARVEGCAGQEMLILEVQDSGCGIAPDKMQDIFSPYYTTKPRGTGLGLSIVHKIVEAHEGSIEVKNGEGGGCVMTMHLPMLPLPPSFPAEP